MKGRKLFPQFGQVWAMGKRFAGFLELFLQPTLQNRESARFSGGIGLPQASQTRPVFLSSLAASTAFR